MPSSPRNAPCEQRHQLVHGEAFEQQGILCAYSEGTLQVYTCIWAAELGSYLGVPDDAGVLGVPVVQAADVGLDHADACLGCGHGLHQAACAGAGPSAQQLFGLQEDALGSISCIRLQDKTCLGTCGFCSMMPSGSGGM